jgi:serine/threonine-protein kinase
VALAPGTRLGPYEVIAQIGAGGMGEVYKARDNKLNRDVALKILPDAWASDADRLARFRREAQVLASLNHPHIGAIHGFEDSGGTYALVLEFVDGPTLADQIAQGPLSMGEALQIAKQIADALEAAHEHGIIHRDLKPANIKVTLDGTVKVLDFGLAKAMEAPASLSPIVSAVPTITSPAMMTGLGVILGTAAYMSPEQAKGRPADKRSDVWAFGCVLYEMLTGSRPFEADDISETLALVLTKEPDWTRLPPQLPHAVNAVLRRCLVKDRRRRTGDIAAVQFVLDEPGVPSAAAVSSASSIWRRMLPVAVGVLLTAGAAGMAWWRLRPMSPLPMVTRFSVALPDGQTFFANGRHVSVLSPDGTQLVYVTNQHVYVRSMSDMAARPLTALTSATSNNFVADPTFSPDGQSLAFFSGADQTLKRIGVTGGAAVTLGSIRNPFGLSWGADGILVGQGSNGVLRFSPNGGTPEVLVKVKPDEVAQGPQMLPGGKAVLFTLAQGSANDRWEKAKIVVQSLTSGERTTLIDGGTDARYLPTGHLVYALRGVILAIAFDAAHLHVSGGPVPVIEGVRRSADSFTGMAQFSVADNGSLAYVPGAVSGSSNTLKTLAIVKRDGTLQSLELPAQPYAHPRLSPNGRSLVFETDDGNEAIVWVYELSGRGSPRRLTFDGHNRSPIWTPDGQRITFASDRDGMPGVFWQPADGSGTAEPLIRGESLTVWRPEAWTPDGRTLALATNGRSNIWTLTRGESKPRKIVDSAANTRYTEFSRDGRWFAYSSSEVGNAFDIFVQPFPPTGVKYQLTTTGARTALWSPDGTQLLYEDEANGPGHIVAVEIGTRPTFTFGKPMPLPVGDGAQFVGLGRQYDMTPDGKQFVLVLNRPTASGTSKQDPEQINVVLNWFTELQQRVPTK